MNQQQPAGQYRQTVVEQPSSFFRKARVAVLVVAAVAALLALNIFLHTVPGQTSKPSNQYVGQTLPKNAIQPVLIQKGTDQQGNEQLYVNEALLGPTSPVVITVSYRGSNLPMTGTPFATGATCTVQAADVSCTSTPYTFIGTYALPKGAKGSVTETVSTPKGSVLTSQTLGL